MVKASDLNSVGRGFESRSDHSAALVNSQLVRLPPAGILKSLCYIYNVFLLCYIIILSSIIQFQAYQWRLIG